MAAGWGIRSLIICSMLHPQRGDDYFHAADLSIGKVTTTNTLHKVGTLTMTNSRALDLGIDPISGEVTIVMVFNRGDVVLNTPAIRCRVCFCELLEYTFVGEDITGYNPGWR